MRRAVVLSGPQSMELCEVALEAPRHDEVRVRLAAAGVCHSDLSVYNRGNAGNLILPAVLGHEGAGWVEAVGPGETTLEPGDHVVLCVVPQCGVCFYCQNDRPTLCARNRMSRAGRLLDGTTRRTRRGAPVFQHNGLGTWAEETIVPVDAAIKIDDSVPFPQAALLGCGVVTGFGAAVNVARIRPGQRVAVIGCGGAGLNGVQGARISGAREIIAIDLLDTKLEMAVALGATRTINASGSTEVVAAVVEVTDGMGVDTVLDFVGSQQSSSEAMAMTRPGGQCVFTGLESTDWQIDVRQFLVKGQTLKANYMGMGNFRADFARLVGLYRDGALILDQLISRTIGLDEIPDAFESMLAGEVARSVVVMSP